MSRRTPERERLRMLGRQRMAEVALANGVLTAEEFAQAYAYRSGIIVEQLRAWGRFPAPCDCGDDGCEGWQMDHAWEDAIVEDRMRGDDWLSFPVPAQIGSTIPILFGAPVSLRLPSRVTFEDVTCFDDGEVLRRVAVGLSVPPELLLGERPVPWPSAQPECVRIGDHTEHEDNTVKELLALARANDEAGFRALASCVVAPGEVDALWAGVRRRIGP